MKTLSQLLWYVVVLIALFFVSYHQHGWMINYFYFY